MRMSDSGDTRPPPPSWLDTHLLQTALRSGWNDDGLSVTSVNVAYANAVGENYGSNMFRVTGHVRTACGHTDRYSVIVKCAFQDDRREAVLRESGIFSREIHVLRDILPAISRLLDECVPGKYEEFSPKFLFTGEDPVTYIVLEDLKVSGFKMAERRKGLDLPHCQLVMKSLARFHAASTVYFEKFPSARKIVEDIIYSQKVKNVFCSFMKTAIHSLAYQLEGCEDTNKKYAEKLYKIEDIFFDELVKGCERKIGGWNALVHFDPWVNNFMFKYSSSHDVVSMRFVDYQATSYSSPALDLQYFFTTSPTEEVRDSYKDILLQTYLAALAETLSDLGCARQPLTMDELHQELQDRTIFGFYAASSVLPIVMMEYSTCQQYETALSRDDTILSDAKRRIYGNEDYLQAIKKLLPAFEDHGIF